MNTRALLGLLLCPALLLGCAAEGEPPGIKSSTAEPAADAPEADREANGRGELQAALARLDRRQAAQPWDHEPRLLKALLWAEAGEVDAAVAELEPLIEEVPDFHLARLLRGDWAEGAAAGAAAAGTQTAVSADAVAGLRHEARVRVAGYRQARGEERVPRALLQLAASVPRALVVDKRTHRLLVFDNPDPREPPRLVRDLYVSTGRAPGDKAVRGDLRTPEGVYFITGHIPGTRLPARYGTGAFPLNYPNRLDRWLGKTGDGIWLHGTEPGYYSRPPLDSEGCVVLTNNDLDALAALLSADMPVVISRRLAWMERDEWRARRASMLRELAPVLGADASQASLFLYPESAGAGRRLVVASMQVDGRRTERYLEAETGGWRELDGLYAVRE